MNLCWWWCRVVLINCLIAYLNVLAIEAPFDESLIEKDLYNILGVDPAASLSDIKKAFRRLAQQYHPDKRPENVEQSTSTFQEISEAYDVLSSKTLREEYDKLRFVATHMNEQDTPFRDGYNEYDYRYYDSPEFVEMTFFDDYGSGGPKVWFSDGIHTNSAANLAGPILHMGQVLFPYDEIMSTLDHTAFALIDSSCSLVVYLGDARVYADSVTRRGDSHHTTHREPVEQEEVYRSPGFPFLQGRCVGVLDYSGVFNICMRDQFGNGGDSLWSTTASNSRNSNGGVVSEPGGDYVMQLTSEGELIIHRASVEEERERWQTSAYQCVWSSLSYHTGVAAAKAAGRTFLQSMRRQFSLESLTSAWKNFRKRLQYVLSKLKAALKALFQAFLS